MWLLNVKTRQLEAFEGSTPPYVILSHRWGKEEITFQDFESGTASKKPGYSKINGFCNSLRFSLTIQYVWVDTCCIDKTNSTELSEAINSMYQWYSGAEACFVHLADVSGCDKWQFRRSEWFSRGWTLQELLAPRTLEFYDRHWTYLGDIESLLSSVLYASGLPREVFRNRDADRHFKPSRHSVADRMFWASKRQTTRIEDKAYSLLGLFEVSMPLIYGERERAFYRLQQEILRQYDDPSILAWQSDGLPGFQIMAQSPASFTRDNPLESWYPPRLPGLVHQTYLASQSGMRLPGTAVTNAGVNLTLMLIPHRRNVYLVPVCERQSTKRCFRHTQEIICVALIRSLKHGGFVRARIAGRSLFYVTRSELDRGQIRNVLLERGSIKEVDGLTEYPDVCQFEICEIEASLIDNKVDIVSALPSDNATTFKVKSDNTGVGGMVRFQKHDGSATYLLFGHDFDYNVFCLAIRSSPASESVDERAGALGVLYFPTIRPAPFQLASNRDMLSLLTSLQDQGLKSLPQYSLTRHQLSWADQGAAFSDVRHGMVIQIFRDGHSGYGLCILGSQAKLKLEPSVCDKWFVKPWKGGSSESDDHTVNDDERTEEHH